MRTGDVHDAYEVFRLDGGRWAVRHLTTKYIYGNRFADLSAALSFVSERLGA
jgi:hypothetical protein